MYSRTQIRPCLHFVKLLLAYHCLKNYGHVLTNPRKQEKGVDTVACMSVNDAFVMSRWIKSLEAADKVTMLADGGGVFAEESGLNVKTGKFGGIRLQRLAMIVSILPYRKQLIHATHRPLISYFNWCHYICEKSTLILQFLLFSCRRHALDRLLSNARNSVLEMSVALQPLLWRPRLDTGERRNYREALLGRRYRLYGQVFGRIGSCRSMTAFAFRSLRRKPLSFLPCVSLRGANDHTSMAKRINGREANVCGRLWTC